jgi:hypothetical protein
MTIWQMKRVALGKSKILLRNGANILKIIIYEQIIQNFSILGLIFHNLSKKCLSWFTDVHGHNSHLRTSVEGYIADCPKVSPWEYRFLLTMEMLTTIQNLSFSGG